MVYLMSNALHNHICSYALLTGDHPFPGCTKPEVKVQIAVPGRNLTACWAPSFRFVVRDSGVDSVGMHLYLQLHLSIPVVLCRPSDGYLIRPLHSCTSVAGFDTLQASVLKGTVSFHQPVWSKLSAAAKEFIQVRVLNDVAGWPAATFYNHRRRSSSAGGPCARSGKAADSSGVAHLQASRRRSLSC
jgi:hypothetical protein